MQNMADCVACTIHHDFQEVVFNCIFISNNLFFEWWCLRMVVSSNGGVVLNKYIIVRNLSDSTLLLQIFFTYLCLRSSYCRDLCSAVNDFCFWSSQLPYIMSTLGLIVSTLNARSCLSVSAQHHTDLLRFFV